MSPVNELGVVEAVAIADQIEAGHFLRDETIERRVLLLSLIAAVKESLWRYVPASAQTATELNDNVHGSSGSIAEHDAALSLTEPAGLSV